MVVSVSFHKQFFSFQFQSAVDVLAMAWPEVRGGGRPPRDCRSREGGGGRVQPTTGHRSLHRISTIDSTPLHLDGDGGGDGDADGHRGGSDGDGPRYYALRVSLQLVDSVFRIWNISGNKNP